MHSTLATVLQLRSGLACATVSGVGLQPNTVCVEGRPVGDGAWHTVRAEHRSHNLVVAVDDGDGWRRNESLQVLLSSSQRHAAPLLDQSQHEVHLLVGTPPEQIEDSLHILNNLSKSKLYSSLNLSSGVISDCDSRHLIVFVSVNYILIETFFVIR